MKSKIWLIILILGVLGILGGLGWKYPASWRAGGQFLQSQWQRFFGKKTAPLGVQEVKKSQEFKFEWKKWEDPAGFAFEYPTQLKVNVHSEDENNYSYLELTSDQKKGKLIILVNDNKYDDLKEWLEKDELAKTGVSLETKIATQSAYKIALGSNRQMVGFVDGDNVLYYLYLEPEEETEWWGQIFEHLTTSFVLIPLKGESPEQFNEWVGGFDTSNVDITEPVEVIE